MECKRNHGVGSPHLRIWDTWAATLKKHSTVQKEDKKIAEHFVKKECKTLEDTATFVELARCSKPCDEDFYRVQFSSFPISQTVVMLHIKYTRIDGGELKTNAAPKGRRERRLEQFLRGNKKDEDEEEEEEEHLIVKLMPL